MTFKKIFIFSLFLVQTCMNISAFNVNATFAGGNIIVDSIKHDTIWIKPDLRDTRGNWFYWCFGVDNAKGKTLSFILNRNELLTTNGPAVSIDGGNNWNWLNPKANWKNSFTYSFKNNDEVRFCMGMEYTEKQFYQFIRPKLKSKYLLLDLLTTTKSGRCVERLFVKSPKSVAKYKVIITGRHHAGEMMSNYVMEGMIQEILKDNWLKDNVEFCFIPFIDKDGVENGDQGKNRSPRDHNRDYDNISLYPSTSEIRKWVPQWAENKLKVAIDIHCPYIKGADNEYIYIVGSANSEIVVQELNFCNILKENNKNELKISEKIYYPFNKGWNKAENFKDGLSYAKWATNIQGIQLATTLEFPFSNNEGQLITQKNTRNFGRDLAITIKKYLQQY